MRRKHDRPFLLAVAVIIGVASNHLIAAFVACPPPAQQPLIHRRTSCRHHHHQSPPRARRHEVRNRQLLLSTVTSSPEDTTTTLSEGLVKTITKKGGGPVLSPGDIVSLRYSCYYGTDPNPFSRSPESTSPPKMVVGDGSMIPGWEKALKTMRVGESAVVQVLDPTTWGYGASGVPGIVPPNSPLVLEIEVLDRQSPTENIDFDSLATADSTPRTASDIAAAFERRQAKKAAEEGPAKEGLEAWIEKARNFYFFGLFEGETGERPPWFLRPSITFPLAFLVVGAAFYITFAGGAIYERGAQVKDELDEFIVSSSNNDNHLLLPASVVLALLSSGGTF